MKKRIFKCFCAVITASIIAASCGIVYADNLLDRYTVDEKFEYSDEMIGNALKVSVPRIYNSFTCTVQYNKLSLNTDRISSLVRNNPYASGDSILTYISENMNSFVTTSTESLSDEFTISGSGVALSDDGYIATNQHVISTGSESLRMSFVQSGYIEEDAKEFVLQIAQLFGTSNMSEEDVQSFYESYVGAMKDSVHISVSDTSLSVIYPDVDGNASLEAGVKYPAQIVKTGKEGTENDIGAEDAAILKIDTHNVVSLPISSDYPAETTKIFAAGFPGASNTIFEATDNTADTLAVTITDGIVSRIVPLSNSNYKMIQTTATVNHGNSGGPSVDNMLRVNGLNTLANAEADGYYWMVPSEVLRDKTNDINIGQGETSKIFMIGLQAMQKGCGATAKECFNEVKKRQPNTPYINKLIERSESMPQKVMRTAFKFEPWMIIAAISVLLVILLIILAVKASKKKNKTVPYKPEAYPHTMPTAAPPIPDMRVRMSPPSSPMPTSPPVLPDYHRTVPPMKNPASPVSPVMSPVVPKYNMAERTESKEDNKKNDKTNNKTTMWMHGTDDLK